jgi:hypothetical protein
LPERVDVDARSLGGAILEAERIFGLPIKPATLHDKYFLVGADQVASLDQADSIPNPILPRSWLQRVVASFVRPQPVRRCLPGFGNTDIHVERNGATLCPKQDLDFVLVPGDVVVFDALLC